MMRSGGKYVLFLVDGKRMAGEIFDNIDCNCVDLDSIGRIEITREASSSLYDSDTLEGVINTITRDAHKPLETGVGYLYEDRGNHKTNISLGSKKNWGSACLSGHHNCMKSYILEGKEPLRTYENGRLVLVTQGRLNISGGSNYSITPKIIFNVIPKIGLTLTPNYYFSEHDAGTESFKKMKDRYYDYVMNLKISIILSEDKKLNLSGAFDCYDKFNYYHLLSEQEKNYENSI